MINNLFPTPVAIYKLERDLSTKELSFIKNQKTNANLGNTSSSDKTILRHKQMTKIRDFVETKVSEYFKTVYNPKNNVSLRITQSWTNYTNKNQYHHRHAHPNSFISGVFYPQANRVTDRIHFYKDGFQQFKFPPSEWNVWNSESWWFEVGSGDLIIFPSSLVHMVEMVNSDETRISLAFNTFPVGSLGDEVEATGLHIGEANGLLCVS